MLFENQPFMKTHYLCFILVFTFVNLNAQVGINTTNPDSSSILEMLADDKGVLIPRVTLTSLSDDSTISGPANSLLVFNSTVSNDIGIGYYYWSTPLGSWIKLLDKVDRPGMIFATFAATRNFVYTAAFAGNKVFNFTNVSFNNITGSSFTGTSLTLPAGNYKVESMIDINRDNFDYILRVNNVQTGVKGTMATVKTQEDIVAKGAIAVFTLTSPTVIDFIPTSTDGGILIPVDPELSYMKITKF